MSCLGYKAIQCVTEDEERSRMAELKKTHKYPVYFFKSPTFDETKLALLTDTIARLRERGE